MNDPNKEIVLYRLYSREPIVAGKWYYAFTCKGCGELIYSLDEPSNGVSPVSIYGDGVAVVPCSKCLHDDTYLMRSAAVVQATESFDRFRPPRVAVSKSSRKPLLPQFKNARPIMGVGLIEDRPKAAAIVGRIITAWSDVEVECARLLARLMGTNVPAAAAVFGALRSSRTQSDAIDAAAQAVLNSPDHLLFTALMSRKASLEKERNDLAHGCYGVEVSIPDAIIWVSQADYINFTTAHQFATRQGTLDKYRKQMFVYELGTLERIAQEIAKLHEYIGEFTGYLSNPNGIDHAEQYTQLCNQPHIREVLKRLQIAKRAQQSHPKAPRANRKGK